MEGGSESWLPPHQGLVSPTEATARLEEHGGECNLFVFSQTISSPVAVSGPGYCPLIGHCVSVGAWSQGPLLFLPIEPR